MDLVFMVDSIHHRMQSFCGNGTVVKQWVDRGLADGQLQYPQGVAVLARSQDRILARSQDRGHPTQNCIFVTQLGQHKIQVFSIDGDGAFIRKWGSRGKGDGQFRGPAGIAVLARDHPTQDLVYVVDKGNHRVQVFGPDGTFVRKWGTPGARDGQFYHPHGVAVLARSQVGGLARSQDRGHPTQDLVFISENDGHRIQAFRSDGTFLFKWGSRGSADGQFSSPEHIALHPTRELLFVADTNNHRVQVFDLDGKFMCKWSSHGKSDDGAFVYPKSIAIHPTQDVVYVGDSRRIQVFSLFPNVRKCKMLRKKSLNASKN